MTKHKTFLFFVTFLVTTLVQVQAQINMPDSTVQVISYWEKGEKQLYTITLEKIKVSGKDTTSKELTRYDVEITVQNTTEKSYTVEWLYKNISSNNNNTAVKKIMSLSNDLKVIYKTDELGVFIEVINWKEIKDYIHHAVAGVMNDYKDSPDMQKVLKQLEATYSTKEAIESASIKDIQQFHMFHGAKYKLAEILEIKTKVPNLLGKEPFDADITVYLDEINVEDNNSILRATQEINKEQLINATYNYLCSMAKNMNVPPPNKDDLKDLKNETLTASRVHGTGWIVYSIQTTTAQSGDATSIEERVIEIK